MSTGQAELLLAAVIAARSVSYLFEKIGLESMEPFTLLGIRFFMAFVFLSLLFWRKLWKAGRSAIASSALLGGVLFCVMACELLGLQTVSSSMASFLENTAIVFVPLFEAFLRRCWPQPRDILVSGAILLGVALLVFQPGSLMGGAAIGTVYCLLAAVLYAVWIIATGCSARQESPLIVGVLSLGFVSLFSMGAALLFESVILPSAPEQWGILLVLSFVCSAFGFTLQPVAQRYVSVEQAGMFCALNPVAAAALGWLFLGERMDIFGLIGAGIIIGSLLLSQKRGAAPADAGEINIPVKEKSLTL